MESQILKPLKHFKTAHQKHISANYRLPNKSSRHCETVTLMVTLAIKTYKSALKSFLQPKVATLYCQWHKVQWQLGNPAHFYLCCYFFNLFRVSWGRCVGKVRTWDTVYMYSKNPVLEHRIWIILWKYELCFVYSVWTNSTRVYYYWFIALAFILLLRDDVCLQICKLL